MRWGYCDLPTFPRAVARSRAVAVGKKHSAREENATPKKKGTNNEMFKHGAPNQPHSSDQRNWWLLLRFNRQMAVGFRT